MADRKLVKGSDKYRLVNGETILVADGVVDLDSVRGGRLIQPKPTADIRAIGLWRWSDIDRNGKVHFFPVYGRAHFYSDNCWCGPVIRESDTDFIDHKPEV